MISMRTNVFMIPFLILAVLSSTGAQELTEADRTRAIQETERGLRSSQASVPRPAEQAGPRDVTGLEWLQMSIGERMDHVMMSLYVLEKYGYTVTGSPNDYYNEAERRLKLDPGLYPKKLTNILAAIVSREGE
jgi:hypothetical protein